MHQTTVRFGADLWEALEDECARLGVSVAQYLREAALTRLVYAAGRRGDDEFELALELATGRAQLPEPDDGGGLEPAMAPGRSAQLARERASRKWSETEAVVAQGELARERSRALRQRAAAERAERRRERELMQAELERAERHRTR
jgi:hypothetical protein